MADRTKYIPAISQERLVQLAAQCKPILQRGNQLRFVEHANTESLKNSSFPWAEDKPGSVRLGAVVEDRLEPIAVITTFHSYGYYGFFKPSAEEVLAQFDSQLTPEQIAEAYGYMVQGPETAADLNRQSDVVNDGFHRATVTVYRKKAQA